MIVDRIIIDEIHEVQYRIFKEFHNVCERLGLKYYIVHGSLIGALKYNDFFPMDDDIDVAMPRKDYDILISSGNKIISKKFFIQSNETDPEYPLTFAKVRDCNSAFIQPIMANRSINQGIYIDVFPIDNYPRNSIKASILNTVNRILTLRVNCVLNDGHKTSKKHKLFQFIVRLLLPSWKKSVVWLCNLYRREKDEGLVFVNGGKPAERGIDSALFANGTSVSFRDISSYAPLRYREYLKIIYGSEYDNYSPVKKYLVDDNNIKISAIVVDTNKSYKSYLK